MRIMYSQNEARALSPPFCAHSLLFLTNALQSYKNLRGKLYIILQNSYPFYYLVAALVILRIIVIYFS